VAGGGFTLSTSDLNAKLVIAGIGTTLSNTSVGQGTLDLSGAGLKQLSLQNGVTFAPGSSYAMSANTYFDIGTGQSSLANVTLNATGNGEMVVRSLGTNVTWSIASTATLRSSGTGRLGINVNGDNAIAFGTNVSIINDGLIESTNTGGILIKPTGTFTNNGTIRATAGTISIDPVGGFINTLGSTLQATGTGVIQILTTNVSNAGTLDASTGTLNISTNTTATYGVTTGATTSVGSTGTLNVGNSNTSAINNAGSFSVVAGGTVNLGTNASPGLFTNNTGGIYQINGTTNTRLTAAGGTITGSGTINALAATSVFLQPGSTLAPGNSPGLIIVGGGLDAGGTLELDISSGGPNNNSNGSGTTTPGTGFDTIQVRPPATTPNTPTNSTVRVSQMQNNLKSANTSAANFAADPFWAVQQKWTIMSTTNGAINLLDANNMPLPSGTIAMANIYTADNNIINFQTYYPNASFTYELLVNGPGNNLNLVWTPVPEPGSLLVLCGSVIAYRRRLAGMKKLTA
jgi:hypothetical protein